MNMKTTEKIKVLLIKPDEHPVVTEIGNTLGSLQKCVGGFIQMVMLSETAAIICNEEGKLNGLDANRRYFNDVIVGDFIIVGIDDEDTVSLSDEDIEKYKKIFWEPGEGIQSSKMDDLSLDWSFLFN